MGKSHLINLIAVSDKMTGFYSVLVHIWSIVPWFLTPQFMNDIDILERGQWRATKQVRGLDHIIYRQKLGKEDLFSHQKGRLRGDLIAANNSLMGRCKADGARLLEVC